MRGESGDLYGLVIFVLFLNRKTDFYYSCVLFLSSDFGLICIGADCFQFGLVSRTSLWASALPAGLHRATHESVFLFPSRCAQARRLASPFSHASRGLARSALSVSDFLPLAGTAASSIFARWVFKSRWLPLQDLVLRAGACRPFVCVRVCS
jgi:hypothetical protein